MNSTTRLRVMSFNIRYGTADDGPNAWELRRELVLKTVRQYAPDFLGTQEGLAFQVEYLAENLPGYHMLGVGRDDGERQGEYAAIFARADRLDFGNGGTRWLSESPTRPGSRSWGASQPRIATWGKYTLRESPHAGLLLFNTHFDQRSEMAREQSARLLRGWIDELAATLNSFPVIVTGDFNATEEDLPYQILRDGTGGPPLVDAYRQAHPAGSDDELTRHDFAAQRHGRRIDWILHSPHFHTLEADIDRTPFNGQHPSDHYPVTATLQMGTVSLA